MSAFIEKQKLVEWLTAREAALDMTSIQWVLDEIASGRFDWTGEGD